MRSIVRLLILGIVVFGGLLGGVQSAQADDELKVGNYLGVIDMSIHSLASQNFSSGGQTYTSSVTINWFGHGYINLTITDAKNGVAKISYLPADIFDFAYLSFTGTADCYASVGIKAQGLFADMGLGKTNFDPTKKTGEITFTFSGLQSHEIVYDTVQGCPLKSMSDAQLIALDETSQHIGTLVLAVTDFNDELIRGDCKLPNWEGSGAVANGSYTHVVDSCDWWASKEGDKEWKDK